VEVEKGNSSTDTHPWFMRHAYGCSNFIPSYIYKSKFDLKLLAMAF
jgi:hypothetical protein